MSSGIQYKEAQIDKFQGDFLIYDNFGDGKNSCLYSQRRHESFGTKFYRLLVKKIDWCDWTN